MFIWIYTDKNFLWRDFLISQCSPYQIQCSFGCNVVCSCSVVNTVASWVMCFSVAFCILQTVFVIPQTQLFQQSLFSRTIRKVDHQQFQQKCTALHDSRQSSRSWRWWEGEASVTLSRWALVMCTTGSVHISHIIPVTMYSCSSLREDSLLLARVPFHTEVVSKRGYFKAILLLSFSYLCLNAVLNLQVRHRLDGRLYAIKRIRLMSGSKTTSKLTREVELLSQVNHENIVRYVPQQLILISKNALFKGMILRKLEWNF